jgi:hypothetical protein
MAAGYAASSATCSASFVGSHTSSASRNAINSPRAARYLRGYETGKQRGKNRLMLPDQSGYGAVPHALPLFSCTCLI